MKRGEADPDVIRLRFVPIWLSGAFRSDCYLYRVCNVLVWLNLLHRFHTPFVEMTYFHEHQEGAHRASIIPPCHMCGDGFCIASHWQGLRRFAVT